MPSLKETPQTLDANQLQYLQELHTGKKLLKSEVGSKMITDTFNQLGGTATDIKKLMKVETIDYKTLKVKHKDTTINKTLDLIRFSLQNLLASNLKKTELEENITMFKKIRCLRIYCSTLKFMLSKNKIPQDNYSISNPILNNLRKASSEEISCFKEYIRRFNSTLHNVKDSDDILKYYLSNIVKK